MKTRSRFPYKTLLGVAVLAAMLFSIVRGVMAGPPGVPRAVDVRTAAREEVPKKGADSRTDVPAGEFIAGAGVVEPAQPETRVAGTVGGRLAALHVKEGEFVKEGTLLATLEGTSERAALAAAEADVLAARAELDRTKRGSRREDVEAAREDAVQARERANLSAGTLARQEALARGGDTTQDELERARRQAAIDSANARAADARRRLALVGSRAEDIAIAQAKLSASEARRDQARAVVERLEIRAPIAGEVLQVKFRVGEYYNPSGSEPLAVLGDTRVMRARIDVDERDIAKLKIGAQSFATADGFSGQRFAGRVVEIARRMGRKNVRTDDPTERLDTKILEVVIEFSQHQPLVVGQRVTGYIETL